MSAATTAYSTNMATEHNPAKTSSRRALGDLTPRAVNSPTQPKNVVEPADAIRPRSPLKKITSHIPSVFADKENFLASNDPSQSRKRGIEDVDDVETAGHAKMLARGRDEGLWDPRMRLTSDNMQQHTQNNPIGLADPGSPTERNTPTPEPEPIQDSQRSNQSFSDLLHYDLCASQKSEAAVESAPVAQVKRQSRAERLRTRLRFASYKVQTNQASKRDMDIISTFESKSPAITNSHGSAQSTANASRPYDDRYASAQGVPDITVSSPKAKFVQVNLDPFRPIGKLGQPPIHFAAPKDGTQISSRTVHGYDDLSPSPEEQLPQSISPEQLRITSGTTMSSSLGEHDDEDIEEGAVAAHRRLQRMKEQSYEAGGDLTSSAVKGNAAFGLLELMSGRR